MWTFFAALEKCSRSVKFLVYVLVLTEGKAHSLIWESHLKLPRKPFDSLPSLQVKKRKRGEELKRKNISGALLALLLINMLALAFNIQHVSSKSEAASEMFYTPSSRGMAASLDKWGIDSKEYKSLDSLRRLNSYSSVNLRLFARCEGEQVELLIGVNASKSQLQSLKEMIFKNGGKITGTISMHEDIKAITALVSINDSYIFAQELRENGLVEYVEPNLRVEAFFTPNDPYWPNQWGPKKVEADAAWNTTLGSSDIIVAIIDTGIDYTHPDLAANYVPLGYDWVYNDNDPLDDNGHGTHCAGIVAATINNAIGIAGLAQVHIMAEKALTMDGWGYDSWIIQAIYHAVDAGAKIISMSFGGFEDSPSVYDAIKYAYDHGVLLVAAAGNEGNTSPNYPAAYDEVIAVSATDSDDNVASFSSYGMWIELAAPGVGIYSTLPTYNVTLNEPPYNRTLNYAYLSGTSMACPHVAGVAALVWSTLPDYANYKIRQILKRTADDLGDAGFDEFYGYGRVNAKRSVEGIPKHDLSISEWRHPYGIRRGEIGIFNATISNYGKSNETDVSVHFLVNQTLIDAQTISSLENETSTLVTFSWSTMTEGNYNVTCYVVPVAGENFMENNIASTIVFVRPSLVLRVPSEYPTIKDALNNAGEDDIIQVASGSYSEGQIDIFKNNVTLVAVGTVTLNGLRTKPALKIVADFVTVERFTIQNSSCGIYVQGHSNNVIGNFILNNGTLNNYHGIYLYKTFDSTISSNSLMSIDYSVNVNTEYGIFLESSSNNTVSMNNVSSEFKSYLNAFTYGIVFYYSSNNIVSLNNVSNLCIGMWIYGSSNNSLISNIAIDNWSGIILDVSPHNKLRNNVMTNNMGNFGVRIENLGSPSEAINDVDVSNTVNGKPIYYWVSKFDANVPLDAGCVVLVNCRGIKLQNLTLANNFFGALLLNTSRTQICSNNIVSNGAITEWYNCGIWMSFKSSNNTVSMNNISYNLEGMWIYGGANNTITSNDIVESGKPGGTWGVVIKATSYCNISFNKVRNTDYGAGICISSSKNNIVNSNSIERGIKGVTISGPNNIVSFNNISECQIGMDMYPRTSNCTIESNNIVSCQRYAAYIMSSTYGNKFFHNNFMGNTVIFFEGGSCGVWDNGYPSGGNYWSDYTGIDEKSGSNQNQPGSDGIGDTPYTINGIGSNKDKYPLMTPWKPISHNVAVVNVLPSKTIIAQGFSASINISLFNTGEHTETFNVSLYANLAFVTQQTVTLGNDASTTITLTWNTSGFARGNYTMKAIADTVEGEICTADNTCIDGLILVTWVGDLNADFDVDEDDLWYFCEAFIDYYKIHVKDPLCDFDNDCDIDEDDLWCFCEAFIYYLETH